MLQAYEILTRLAELEDDSEKPGARCLEFVLAGVTPAPGQMRWLREEKHAILDAEDALLPALTRRWAISGATMKSRMYQTTDEGRAALEAPCDTQVLPDVADDRWFKLYSKAMESYRQKTIQGAAADPTNIAPVPVSMLAIDGPGEPFQREHESNRHHGAPP